MGAKKQAGKAAKKVEEEDLSTKELLTAYKKSCKELEIPIYKPIELKITKQLEENTHLFEILVNEQMFGPIGVKSVTKALKATNKGIGYKHLQSLRLWDSNTGDEGIQYIVDYMSETSNTSISLIEILNGSINANGCLILSKLFDPGKIYMIKYLILDYNHFGNEGLANLMINMKDAKYLKYLSLGNCFIDENGIKLFTDYLNNSDVKLEELNLQGNPLKNSGVSELFTILYYNTSICEINLNNTQCGNDPDLALLLARLMQTNTNLGAYYLNFNYWNNDDMEIIMREALRTETCKHIWRFKIDEKISKELFKEYYLIMKKRKKPKKKGKKNKKGAKKTKKK